jgi:hypothetical protein
MRFRLGEGELAREVCPKEREKERGYNCSIVEKE